MVRLRRHVGALGVLGAVFPALLTAQNTTSAPAASTFFLPETETQFSLNIANDSTDVFIYFTSPAYSWVGVGFGDKMEDSLMFIMYPNSNGDNVTISPRLGSAHREPSFTPSTPALDILPGTQINDSMLVLHARCRSCRVWPNGFLDAQSSAHPMIYAFGPGHALYSNSPSADLKRHVRYGRFSMDMRAATGAGGVPVKSNAVSGVRLVGDMVRDHDRANLAHAIVGCVALFVVWPLNVLVAGFVRDIRVHVGISGLVLALLVVAYALGGTVSGQFNRSKSFTTPHQITAFITLAPLLLLPALTLRPLARLHPKLPTLHTPLSTFTLLLLILTGGLGLHLSSQARPVILGYTAVSLLVFVFAAFVGTCVRRRGSAYARAQGRRGRGRSGNGDDVGEEDEQRLVMMKMGGGSGSGSVASLERSAGGMPPPYGYGPSGGEQRSPGRATPLYGAGTMPGPQYLLNMHPGVPVQVGRL